MCPKSWLLIWLLILIIYFIVSKNIFNLCDKSEPFYTSNMIKQHKADSPFNDKMIKETSFLENDNMLMGSLYYENDIQGATGQTEWVGASALTGYEKCLTMCNGNCLEYGITGTAWCFEKPLKAINPE
jgi:hypothetical protein